MYSNFPKLFDHKTNFQVTLLKNGLSPDQFASGTKPSKADILSQLPQYPVKLEPEITLKEGTETLNFLDNIPLNNEAKKPKLEIASKEVVVHKDFNDLKRKIDTPLPIPRKEFENIQRKVVKQELPIAVIGNF